MDGACSTHGREERCVQGFAGVTGGKETLEKSVRRRIFEKSGVADN
jgi:hypothetical protein